VFGRTGAVTLTSSDISGALGFSPVGLDSVISSYVPYGADPISSSDSLLGAIAKLQAQVSTKQVAGLYIAHPSDQSDPIYAGSAFSGLDYSAMVLYGSNATCGWFKVTGPYGAGLVSIGLGDGRLASANNKEVIRIDGQYVSPPTYVNYDLYVGGNLYVTGTISASVSGNASTASKLSSAKTISATGDASWSVSFDGSSNVSAALTLGASGVTAGTYKSVTVDVKGRVTAGSNPTTLAGYGITDAVSSSDSRLTDARTPINQSWYVYGDNATASRSLTDFNAVVKSGFSSGPSATGAPTTGWYHLITNKYHGDTTGWLFQIAAAFGTTATPAAAEGYYVRIKEGTSAPTAWRTLWHSGNFVPSNYLLKSAGSSEQLTGALYGLRGSIDVNASLGSTFATFGHKLATGANMAGFAFNESGTVAIVDSTSNIELKTAGVTKINIDSSGAAYTGNHVFAQRPTFGGAIPWDSNNFNPSGYVTSSSSVVGVTLASSASFT
jgi:hypothetical protein